VAHSPVIAGLNPLVAYQVRDVGGFLSLVTRRLDNFRILNRAGHYTQVCRRFTEASESTFWLQGRIGGG
jgi:hypothetical protein